MSKYSVSRKNNGKGFNRQVCFGRVGVMTSLMNQKLNQEGSSKTSYEKIGKEVTEFMSKMDLDGW